MDDRIMNISMKKFYPLVVILLALYVGWEQFDRPEDSVGITDQSEAVLASAFKEHKNGIQVEGRGVVIKILPDDNYGSRHQRFILRLNSGQTLVVAHNIDLAPKLSDLKERDVVTFNGEYEWNSKGGVLHWTHRDPRGRHVAGWLKHNGILYQ